MMIPGMWAGWLQQQLGYVQFFIWACVATVPSFIATALIRVDPNFGRKAG
jgi:MFS transporter, PAT family, beta-lactamase induction signal transducer AmpG